MSEPFANFYFGGFRNNWVDYRDEKRYRQSYAFPGLGINEVGGTQLRAVDARVEPAARALPTCRHARLLRYVAPARRVRVDARHQPGRRRAAAHHRNVGGQVDFRLGVLSRLDLTLSAGYAVAFENGLKTRNEVMVSLKVLR